MQCSRRWRLAAKLRRRSALLRRRAVCALLRCRASMMSCCFVLCSSVDVLRALLRRRDLLFARDLVCFARSATRSSAVFFAALRAAVAHLLPSLSFPAKTNQQGPQLPHYPGLMGWTCGRTGLKPSLHGRERTHCVHGRRDRRRFREASPLQKRHLAESGPAAQSPLCSPRPQGTNRAEKFSSFFAGGK